MISLIPINKVNHRNKSFGSVHLNQTRTTGTTRSKCTKNSLKSQNPTTSTSPTKSSRKPSNCVKNLKISSRTIKRGKRKKSTKNVSNSRDRLWRHLVILTFYLQHISKSKRTLHSNSTRMLNLKLIKTIFQKKISNIMECSLKNK